MRRAGIVAGILGLCALMFMGGLLASRRTLERKYHLYVVAAPPSEKVMSLRGDEIRADNGCLQVLLNGRVDTVVCGRVMLTEDQATTGVR